MIIDQVHTFFNFILNLLVKNYSSVPNYKSLWEKNLSQIINRFTIPMKH